MLDAREAFAMMRHAYDPDDASPYFEKNERPVMGGAPTTEAAPRLPAGNRDHEPRSAFFSGE